MLLSPSIIAHIGGGSHASVAAFTKAVVIVQMNSALTELEDRLPFTG